MGHDDELALCRIGLAVLETVARCQRSVESRTLRGPRAACWANGATRLHAVRALQASAVREDRSSRCSTARDVPTTFWSRMP